MADGEVLPETPAQAAARPLLERFLAAVHAPERWNEEYGKTWKNHVDRAHFVLGPWEALSDSERRTLIEHFPRYLADDEHVDSTSRAECHAAIQESMGYFDPVPWTLLATFGNVYGNMNPAAAKTAVVHVVYPDDLVDQTEAFDVLRQSVSNDPKDGQAVFVINLPRIEDGIQQFADGSTYVPPEEWKYNPVYEFLAATAVVAPNTKLVFSTLEEHRDDWKDIDDSARPPGRPTISTFNHQRIVRGCQTIRYAPVMNRLTGISPNRAAPHPTYRYNRRMPTLFDRWRDPKTGGRADVRPSFTPGRN